MPTHRFLNFGLGLFFFYFFILQRETAALESGKCLFKSNSTRQDFLVGSEWSISQSHSPISLPEHFRVINFVLCIPIITTEWGSKCPDMELKINGEISFLWETFSLLALISCLEQAWKEQSFVYHPGQQQSLLTAHPGQICWVQRCRFYVAIYQSRTTDFTLWAFTLFILEIGALPGEKYKPIWGESASRKNASSLLLEVTSCISSIISILIRQLQRNFLFKSPLCHPRAVDKGPVVQYPPACREVKQAGA